jgi:hypothetical protein
MAGNIFINYRRDDDAGFTQALYSRLEQAFPSGSLFMDVDNIAPGLDFVQVLNEEVARCDVVIAVIGKNWLAATDESGERRLDNPEDFVRIEIEPALAQKKRVIPVLVNDAKMPRSTELPESMKAFARCNAVRLTHERFRADTQSLIKALGEALSAAELERRERRKNDAASNGAWKGFRAWVVGLAPGESWLVPLGFIAVVLFLWRLPALFYWLYMQGSGELTGLFGLSALFSVAGLLMIIAGMYLRRDSLTGSGLALGWLAVFSLLSLLVNSVMIAGRGSSLIAAARPCAVAILSSALVVSLRGRQMGGLEGAVYLMGSALFANIVLVSSLLGTEGAAGVELAAAAVVASAGLAIAVWRRHKASGAELAVYGFSAAYILGLALIGAMGASGTAG